MLSVFLCTVQWSLATRPSGRGMSEKPVLQVTWKMSNNTVLTRSTIMTATSYGASAATDV